MKINSYLIKRDDLTDSQLEMLVNISGAWNSEYSFSVNITSIKDCLELTEEMNDGSEAMDCIGRTWIPNYDEDIKFMKDILNKAEGCDYIIIDY